MAEITETSPDQSAAIALYRWYQGEMDSAATAREVCLWISQRSGANPLSPQQLAQSLERIRQHASFTKVRDRLLQRWRPLMSVCNRQPDRAATKQILMEWIESQDHGLVFSQRILANITEIHTGSIGDITFFQYSDRDFWSLHVTLKGRGLYCSTIDILTQPGDILLLGPQAHYHSQRHPDCSDWHHAWAIFQPKDDWSYWLGWPQLAEDIYKITVDDTTTKQLKNLLQSIQKLDVTHPALQEELGLNLLEQILIRLRHTAIPNPTPTRDPRIKRAIAFIHQQLSEPLPIAILAEHCHLSESRLAHLFKQEMGVGPKQYYNRLRLQQARKQLINSDEPIEYVAIAMGYGNSSQFSKAFRKQTGFSPRQFRQLNRLPTRK